MKQHNFTDSLALSNAQVDAPWWLEIYQKAFPTIQSYVSVREDGWAQRGGIDRVITLASGKTISIDEKVREKDWGDILLEYWSDRDRKTKGWIAKDLACDYIAYAFVPTGRCFLLPFLTLRQAWLRNKNEWVKKYPRIEAQNKNYVTVSVAIPIDILFPALTDAMEVKFTI